MVSASLLVFTVMFALSPSRKATPVHKAFGLDHIFDLALGRNAGDDARELIGQRLFLFVAEFRVFQRFLKSVQSFVPRLGTGEPRLVKYFESPEVERETSWASP